MNEAGIHPQTMKSRAWSRKGVPATVKVHTQKGVNINIIGCITSFGIGNFSEVDPKGIEQGEQSKGG